MNWLKRGWWGWLSRWPNIIHIFLMIYGSLWLIVESLGAYDKERFSFLQSPKILYSTIALSLVYSLIRNWFRSSISFTLPHSNTKITVKFADFFNEPGVKSIPVNEFFDGELGVLVSKSTIHGQFIAKHFGGNSASFFAISDPLLATYSGQQTAKSRGKSIKYPIGTTISIDAGNEDYLLFALCRTDLTSFKADSDLSTYMLAMDSFWAAARDKNNGNAVVVPLIGTGLAGIGLPPSQMLDLLLLTFVAANKKKEVCTQLVITLYPPRFKEFNLLNLEEAWS